MPVIIHLLLKRRQPPMAWGAMRFVLEAYRRTRRRSIERWLLLAARVLLLLLAGLVLARPIIGRTTPQATGDAAGGRTLWIVLDNSILSGATAEGQSDLARSVASASALLDQLGPGDRAGLVLTGNGPSASASESTLASSGQIVPASIDLPAVRAALQRITPTDAAPDWSAALSTIRGQIASERQDLSTNPAAPSTQGRVTVLLASGLRAGSVASLRGSGGGGPGVLPVIEGAEVLALAPRVQRAANVSIRSLAAARPVLLTGQDDAAQTISITLARSGVVDGASTSTLAIYALDDAGRIARDVELGRTTHTWAPGQREATVTVAVSAARPTPAPVAQAAGSPAADLGVLVAEILGDDALPADNRAALPLLTREVLRVGLIDGPSSVAPSTSVGTNAPTIGGTLRPAQWARLALRPSDSSPIEVTNIEPLAVDAGRLAGLDALWILSPDALDAGAWRRIAAWHRAGNLLIISPPAGLANHTWASAAAGDGAQPMAAAMGLDLSLPLTATIAPDEQPWRLALAPSSPDDLDRRAGLADLLAPIRGEMAELVRPVGLTRLLAPDLDARPLTAEPAPAAPAHAARVLLATTDGRPVVTAWRARPASAPAASVSADAPPISTGIIVYLSFAPEASWADIVAKPLMVPLVQELVRQGVGLSRPGRAIVAGEAMGLARRTPQGTPNPANSALPAPALTLQSLDGAPALTLRSDAGPVRAGIYRLTSASTASASTPGAAPDASPSEPSLLVVNPAPADTSTVDRQQATAALASIAPRVDGQVDRPAAGIRLIDDRGQALASSEASTPDARPAASSSTTPARREGTPIGAGVSLLWIVLALALVESALAWSTARRGVASPARAAATGGGAA